jgi:hypothetical protein
MDSSVKAPYIKKGFRSKLPVKKPREKNIPQPKMLKSISLVERMAIDKLQAKLRDENASAIQRAIRKNLARKAVKTMRESKPKPKNEIVPKVKVPKNEIVPKIKVPKNEIVPKVTAPATAKPKKERKAKINYKMSYAAALKVWNTSHNTGMYCNPRKGSDEYKAVQALRL